MICQNCGRPIIRSYSKYTLGWTHEGGDAYCRLSFAEPDPADVENRRQER